MHDRPFRHLASIAGLGLAAATILLWSWNTLAELFPVPSAEFRHAAAAAAMLLVLRFMLHCRRRRGSRQGQPS